MVGEIGLIILAVVLILVALAGVVLPILPGAPVAWVGIFIYALATDFREVSVQAVVWLGALALFTLVLDVLGPVLGAKNQKAGGRAIFGSILGALLGAAVLGPVGILLGPFLGAFLGELSVSKDADRAFKSAVGALAGFFVGAVIKIGIVLIMAGYFAYALIF
jgi:uncharacterized protein YqgC (DUF456 family)